MRGYGRGVGAVHQAVQEEAAQFLDAYLLLGDGASDPQAAESPTLVLELVPVEQEPTRGWGHSQRPFWYRSRWRP
jgi:hypothetical protein